MIQATFPSYVHIYECLILILVLNSYVGIFDQFHAFFILWFAIRCAQIADPHSQNGADAAQDLRADCFVRGAAALLTDPALPHRAVLVQRILPKF